jgi:NTE family protein
MLIPGSDDRSDRVGLALAGGGPEGAVYEIGVLRALDEALEGLDFNRLPVYVGVSAGAFVAANLANGLTTAQNIRAIFKPDPRDHPFHPGTFFKPALAELVRRGSQVPRLIVEALVDFAERPYDQTLLESLLRLSQALPVGLFDNEPIHQYLHRIYTIKGRTDDFRELAARLIIVATDLDSGVAVRFGEPGRDHVPISRAVQASAALPGLYSPVRIDGRQYVDGVLLKTMHASVALESGADLVLCVNPLVPVDILAGRAENGLPATLTELGLPFVLSQTFRTLIHSRLAVGIAAYAPRFPEQDLVLIEPQPDDYGMFFTNIFSFAQRKEVCEYAYRATRRDLLRRYDELAPVFSRHGLRLRREVLEDPNRDLWTGVGLRGGPRPDRVAGGMLAVERLEHALDTLEHWLARQELSAPEEREGGPRSRGGATSSEGRTAPRGRRGRPRGTSGRSSRAR